MNRKTQHAVHNAHNVVLSLMVEPLGGAVGPWQRVLHALQAPVKGLCRENTLRRGKKNR